MKPAAYVTLALLAAISFFQLGCSPMTSSQADAAEGPVYNKGLQFVQSRDYDRAAQLLEYNLLAHPSHPSSHMWLGRIYGEHLHDPIIALYHYHQFLKLAPDSHLVGDIKGKMDAKKLMLAKSVRWLPLEGEIQHEVDKLLLEIEDLKMENESLQTRLAEREGSPGPEVSMASARLTPRSQEARLTREPSISSQVYHVRQNDNFYRISKKYGVSVKALKQANPSINPQQLRIDQAIRIPHP